MYLTARALVLGCPVGAVAMGAAVRRLVELLGSSDGEPALLFTLNPEILMRVRREVRG